MRLIIIDLTSGVLADEKKKAARKGAREMLRSLARQCQLAAYADTSRSGLELRGELEDLGLGVYFQNVTTSADLGAVLSPIVVQRIASAVGTRTEQTAVISSDPPVVDSLQMAGIVALLTDPSWNLEQLPEALAWITAISS